MHLLNSKVKSNRTLTTEKHVHIKKVDRKHNWQNRLNYFLTEMLRIRTVSDLGVVFCLFCLKIYIDYYTSGVPLIWKSEIWSGLKSELCEYQKWETQGNGKARCTRCTRCTMYYCLGSMWLLSAAWSWRQSTGWFCLLIII